MSKTDDPRISSTDGVTPGYENASAPGPVKANGQHESYWILSPEERAKGWVRPYRDAYIHKKCGTVTRMSRPIAETYARDPKFYGATFCVGDSCRTHFPVSEFLWDGTNEEVGS